jgi:mevalonate kinase
MAIGSACAKIILFGEHFVLYGEPALACGLSLRTDVEVAPAAASRLETDPALPPAAQQTAENAVRQLMRQLTPQQALLVRARSNVPPHANLGSSAAFCVALVRALADHAGRFLTDERVAAYATEAEHLFHGKSSGLDVAVATYGGAVVMRPGKTAVYERRAVPAALHLVVACTPAPARTGEMIKRVAALAAADPEAMADRCARYRAAFRRGLAALDAGDIPAVGAAMTANHQLLRELGVSTDALDRGIGTAQAAGAVGAKLTGGGGGGSLIALCPSTTVSEQVEAALSAAGLHCRRAGLAPPHAGRSATNPLG